MSNYLAVATVSAAIGTIAGTAIKAVPELSSTPAITYGVPKNSIPPYVGANIFMYQFSQNTHLQTPSLPVRGIEQPLVAVDLFYIVTFYGDENRLEPQRLMGAVLTAFEMNKIIPHELLYEITQLPEYRYLQDSDLHKQIDVINLENITFNVDEVFQLWSLFSPANYSLSVFYKVSTVVFT